MLIITPAHHEVVAHMADDTHRLYRVIADNPARAVNHVRIILEDEGSAYRGVKAKAHRTEHRVQYEVA